MQVSASRRSFVVLGAITLALGAGAGAATIAGGQSSAGPPTGTLSFKVRIGPESNRQGINPAVPRDKKRPKVADLSAANADVLSMDGQTIGRAHDFDVTTFEGAKKYKGKAISYGNSVIDFGSGNFLSRPMHPGGQPDEQQLRGDRRHRPLRRRARVGGRGLASRRRGQEEQDVHLHGDRDLRALILGGRNESPAPAGPLVQSGGRGSNSRPSAWEADALPTELPPHAASEDTGRTTLARVQRARRPHRRRRRWPPPSSGCWSTASSQRRDDTALDTSVKQGERPAAPGRDVAAAAAARRRASGRWPTSTARSWS